MNLSFSCFSTKHFFWLVLLVAVIAGNSLWLSQYTNQTVAPSLELNTYAAASATLIRNNPSPSVGMTHTAQDPTIIANEYNFHGYHRDRLTLAVSIPRNELRAYQHDYGYHQTELDTLTEQRQAALTGAYQYAVELFLDQAELDKMSAKINQEFDAKVHSFFEERGFKFLSAQLVTPDLPGIVRRNVHHLKPVAVALDQLTSQMNYAAADILPTALTLVQTALAYRNIPEVIDQRHTAGIYPPLVTLAEGAGDCDSKTALLAAILLNWNEIRLIGLGVPDHYLLGVMKNPGKGDLFIEYQGVPYVLMEPAGPAWLPVGSVSEYTLQTLNSGGELQIDPLSI